jgi:hypothetical protein
MKIVESIRLLISPLMKLSLKRDIESNMILILDESCGKCTIAVWTFAQIIKVILTPEILMYIVFILGWKEKE